MFKIQLEITCHTKNQENLNVANTHAKMADVLDLCDKFSKATIIKMFQGVTKDTFEEHMRNPGKNQRCILSLLLFNIAQKF